MITRELQKIDPAAVMRVAEEVAASFDSTLTPTERAALEKLRANEGDSGLMYSTAERERALEDFELLGALDTLRIVVEQIQATLDRREQELYRQVVEVYWAAVELAQDPANAHLIQVVEDLRRAHLADYGVPIPEKASD